MPNCSSSSALTRSSRSLVNVPLNMILSLKAPTWARSSGSSRRMNCSAAALSSFRLAFMLKLKSIITTAVNGWTSFWKKTISCGLPLSSSAKSSRDRSGTSRPSLSSTVASTETMLVPVRKVACCASAAEAAASTTADARKKRMVRV
ncbi:hypothetical protein D3C83_22060 [compost metagenome]